MSFDYFSYNNLPQFSSDVSIFSFNANTFYWLSVSVDIPKFTQTNLSMNDEFSLVKTNTLLSVNDTLCKDELFHVVNPNEGLSMISLFSTNAIYGFGFQLDTLFYPLIAFHVTHLGCVEQNPIVLDTIHQNIGNAWNSSTNKFVAPSNGLYYFSINFKISTGPGDIYKMMHNGNDVCFLQKGMANSLISKGNFDFMPKSCFINMKKTDNIELWAVRGINCAISNNEQISLSGFNYSPKNNLQVK